tara:strand:+ start:1414 stop:2889 length:1476 start_codon:yes stop_codon:yes gene_type:complete
MQLLSFIWRRITAALGTLAFLLLIALVFLLWRAFSGGQQDNAEHLAAKQDYLGHIEAVGLSVSEPPNIVFFLYDDMGYGDIGFGARGNDLIATPHIDQLATQGVVLSDFHSPAAVCTPSRAGFLTGRLAPRAGLTNVVFPSGSVKDFVFSKLIKPDSNVRLPAEEITLADLLNAAGYATGMVGKWHLGDTSPSLPNDMGFDSYFGALYSNDMEPFALYANRDVAVAAPADQRLLTERYTREAVQFIDANASEPFFLYFAHNFPHDPLYVREERLGNSRAGLYGDVIEEIDESVGTIMAALERAGVLENTLVIVTSDNGPWFLGNAGDQRGRKGNTFEGGMRVPFIAHWPAAIAPGRVEHAMTMGTDILPTVLEILKLPAPPDRIIDGQSILGVLTEGAPTPHDFLHYYAGDTLFATRDQRFKYRGAAGVFYGPDQMGFGGAMAQKEWLFDLLGDERESYDTSATYPREVERLRAAFRAKQAAMKENPRGWR